VATLTHLENSTYQHILHSFAVLNSLQCNVDVDELPFKLRLYHYYETIVVGQQLGV